MASKRLAYLLGFVGIVLWGGSLLAIATFSDDYRITIALSVLGALSLVGMGIYFFFQRFHNNHLHKTNLTAVIHNTLANYHEVHLFDETGKTLFSTHPHLYAHKKEFLRRLMLRVQASPETTRFKKWLEEHYPGEILLAEGGDGLGQQQRWWLAHVSPIDPLLVGGRHLLLVTMTEVTKYLTPYHQLKAAYHQLESFLDNAPFALFYTNRTGHIVGSNDTFGQWLGLDRNEILGQPLAAYIENWNSGQALPLKPLVITLKPSKKSAFKALWFPPSLQSKDQVSFLCRLDDQLIAGGLQTHKGGGMDDTFNQAPIPAVVIQEDGRMLSFNPAFAAMISDVITVNHDRLKLGGNLYEIVHPSTRGEIANRLRNIASQQTAAIPFEMRFEGIKTHTTAYATPLKSSMSLQPSLLIQFIDISEQKRLEQQFIQSQKMQAVGQLAGGIAHDFNNLLTAMIGFCDLLLQRYMPSDPSYTDIIQIKQNANRAANLVRQLLAFSRQQNLQPKVINITDTLAELSALLRRLIGAGIDLQMIHGRDLWPVRVDASQLEQVIINLAVNARDAMSQGGNLIIRTGHYQLPRPRQLGHETMPVGDYVLIEVVDTGHGIQQEHLDHIFEPFFSTKELGSGTGLGLSTVYGIVKQTGGFIAVESEQDHGTIFKLFLPRYDGVEPISTIEHEQQTTDLTGSETILLVEDEDAVRLFSGRALREKGYRVLEANSGDAALDIIKKGEVLDLLITDVVMPKMDGPTLNKKVRDLLPHIKTIFISGYAEDTFRRNLDDNAQIHFLAKPFTLKDLAAKVKDVLHAKKR
ncbi:ATP-binding protein [Candidatus Finniella inopinata]|uniref:histidine kinase n=1 Tax=Candidatus Finniella inopinata TaxID=1696036 RepID=A0A4Q7DFY9_9PROT|nr:ATP-binding protein [Candidatus Finniella inopinata]RZI45741.1 response regulator [Candidatus Finniella inopinata]